VSIDVDARDRAPPGGDGVTRAGATSWSGRRRPRPDAATAVSGRGTYPLYIAANIAPRVAMFVLLMVFTRVLPVEQFGLFALVITMGEILDMTAANWVRVYILRAEAGASGLSARRLGRALGLNFGATLLSTSIAAIAVPLVSDGHAGALVLGTITYIVAFSLARLTLTFAQLTQRHVVYAVIEAARAVGIATTIAIVALTHIHSFLPACLILSLMTGAICAISLLYTLRDLPRPRLSHNGYLAALEFGLPFMLAALLSYTLGWFDRFIINHFAGPAAVAVYVAAFALARQPVELLVGPLNNYIFPILVRAYADDRRDDAAAMQVGAFTSIIAVSTATVAGLTLLAQPLTTLFFPASYRASVVPLIPLVAIGTLFLTLKQFVFDNSFHITKRTWLLLGSTLPSALVSVTLGIVLIRAYGGLGAAITYVVATAMALVISATISLRVFSFVIPWRGVASIVAATAAASALAWVVHPFVVPVGVIAEIVVEGVLFSAVYAGVLTALGISVRHLVELPWVRGG